MEHPTFQYLIHCCSCYLSASSIKHHYFLIQWDGIPIISQPFCRFWVHPALLSVSLTNVPTLAHQKTWFREIGHILAIVYLFLDFSTSSSPATGSALKFEVFGMKEMKVCNSWQTTSIQSTGSGGGILIVSARAYCSNLWYRNWSRVFGCSL